MAGATTRSNGIAAFPALEGSGVPARSVTQTSSSALTNKTLDVEALGNAVTIPEKRWLPVARCNNATSILLWDSETTNAPSTACITGTNTQKAVADFDPTTDECLQTTLCL